jgi:hypothetical protein
VQRSQVKVRRRIHIQIAPIHEKLHCKLPILKNNNVQQRQHVLVKAVPFDLWSLLKRIQSANILIELYHSVESLHFIEDHWDTLTSRLEHLIFQVFRIFLISRCHQPSTLGKECHLCYKFSCPHVSQGSLPLLQSSSSSHPPLSRSDTPHS